MAFALGTFSDRTHEFAGLVLDEERVIDLSRTFGSTRSILEDWSASLPRLAELADAGSGRGAIALDSLRVLPPVGSRQILQSGANYRKHVIDLIVDQELGERPDMSEAELRAEGERMMDARAAGEPYVFLGAVSAVCGPYDDVVLPDDGQQHDWELELAAVIGRPQRRVPPESALELVAGYTICNDVTTRDRVFRSDVGRLGADWVWSKNSPTFLPTGPWIVPAQFVPDPLDLHITLKLNGDVMQDESTADMIFDVAKIISYASHRVELLPGDLVLTGSPAGNGAHWNRFLEEGDVIDSEITGLGRQHNRCVREQG